MNDANKKKVMTLVVIHAGKRVLLGMKKRGFGAGRWNGFGGKIEEGESIEKAARRELFEECAIEANELFKIGEMEFMGEDEDLIEVHLFKANEFSGQPTESDEMMPKWFSTDELPFEQMWPDDRHWFPFFIKNIQFKAKFSFGPGNKIIDYDIKETKL